MNIELLKEQLQENLVSFFDGQDQDTLDLMCSVIINTINDVELV